MNANARRISDIQALLAQKQLLEANLQAEHTARVRAQEELHALRATHEKAQRDFAARDEYREQEAKELYTYAFNVHNELEEAKKPKSTQETTLPSKAPKSSSLRQRKREHRKGNSRVVKYTHCYAHGLECDNGARCGACVKGQTSCKRKQCNTYGLGPGKCRRCDCPFAHPEDGYEKTISMVNRKATRDKGLPPVTSRRRW